MKSLFVSSDYIVSFVKTKSMKLELKHLAPYLPYGLNCMIPIQGLVTMVGIQPKKASTHKYVLFTDYSTKKLTEIKPVLRPLSDLTKEIEQLEEFCPHSEDERYNENGEDGFEFNLESFAKLNGRLKLNWFSYGFYEKLFELHFDVFGLIEKGLAKDLNACDSK